MKTKKLILFLYHVYVNLDGSVELDVTFPCPY